MVPNRKRLGDLLLEAGVLTERQLEEALEEQKRTKLRLGDQLIALGLISEQPAAHYR